MGALKSAINLKCPKCGKGELFESKSLIPHKGMLAMHTNCSHCGLKYEKEMGFFYGAMYISYMINIALFVICTVVYYIFFETTLDWRWYITAYVFVTLLLTSWIYKFSRSFWMMIMIKAESENK
jgi:uncharacterized protein (DUF983 family)